MQVTIDIPDSMYQQLESQARESETSLENLLLRRAGQVLDQNAVPVSSLPDAPVNGFSLILKHFTSLNDAMFMTDEEFEELRREAPAREAAEHAKPS